MASSNDPSGSPSAVPRADSPSGSPHGRAPSVSLQAAATMNAGLNRELSPRSSNSSLTRANRSGSNVGRRRSTVLMNLQHNDPSVPAPGEMVTDTNPTTGHRSPHQGGSGSPLLQAPSHHRAPSLGELHQELEAEQEGQVNRLLQMIRQQQLELQRLQAANPNTQSAAVDDTSAISDRQGQPIPQALPTPPVGSYSRSPGFHHPRASLDMARADLHRRSRTPSRGASPRLRSTSISADSGDWMLGGRDESAFYQAETQMLTRENQMLRHRIRDLEKQLSDVGTSPVTNEPTTSSQLRSPSNDEGAEASKPAQD